MAAIVKLPSSNWRVQVRRKNSYVSNTFRRRADAEAWALEAERTIDKGLDPKSVSPQDVKSFSDIVDPSLLHPVTQRPGRAADLRGYRTHRRPAGLMFTLMFQNHPDRAGTDFT